MYRGLNLHLAYSFSYVIRTLHGKQYFRRIEFHRYGFREMPLTFCI